jgi:hypothetical protein
MFSKGSVKRIVMFTTAGLLMVFSFAMRLMA